MRALPIALTVLKLAIALFALEAAGLGTHAVAAAATASASATVLEPVAVTTSSSLSFGRFAAGTGGSVSISTSGVRTASGVIPSADGSTMTAAKFVVTGAAATYSVAHGGASSLSRSAGSATMALTKFSDVSAGNATSGMVSSGTLTGGSQAIYVGGTLNVAANQPTGNYSGEISVTVEYY